MLAARTMFIPYSTGMLSHWRTSFRLPNQRLFPTVIATKLELIGQRLVSVFERAQVGHEQLASVDFYRSTSRCSHPARFQNRLAAVNKCRANLSEVKIQCLPAPPPSDAQRTSAAGARERDPTGNARARAWRDAMKTRASDFNARRRKLKDRQYRRRKKRVAGRKETKEEAPAMAASESSVKKPRPVEHTGDVAREEEAGVPSADVESTARDAGTNASDGGVGASRGSSS